MASLLNGSKRNKVTAVTSQQEFNASVDDYNDTYTTPQMIFKIVGIRLMREDSPTKRLFWNFLFWFQFANVVLGGFLAFLQMVDTALGGTFEDLVLVFRMMPVFGFNSIAISKSYKIVYYRLVFENLISELRGMWPQGKVTKEEHEILKKSHEKLNFILKVWTTCLIFLVSIFMLLSYMVFLQYLAGYDVQLILPVYYKLPFDQFQRGYYEVLLFVQTWHSFLTVCLLLSGDLLFCLFVSHISTQFQLLRIRIKKLVYVPIDGQLIKEYPLGQTCEDEEAIDHDNLDELAIQHELREIIIRHIAIVRLCGDVEQMYTFSLLVNFLNSTLVICFCGFCSVYAEKWNEVVYKTFLLSAIFQIWLYCWFGQRLIDSSTSVAEALYNCGWYTASKKIKTSILIMMHRAQNEVHLTTYGFTVVSLSSFTSILKTSWSYFTLLTNVYNR